MSRDSWFADHMPAFHDTVGSTAGSGYSVRLFLLSLLQAGVLLALVTTFVVWAVGPAATDAESPDWSVASGHATGVRSIAFSRDGRRLATAGEDGCIVLWEVGNGVEEELVPHRQSRVLCLAFSPDGMTLASGHDDHAVVLWDVTTGQERATLMGHADAVRGLDFSPDGAVLASCGFDRRIRLWDVASGKLKAVLCDDFSQVCSVRFSPDRQTLASGTNGLVNFWDLSSGKYRQSLRSSNDYSPVTSIVFSPDGSTLAYGGLGCDSIVCDLATGLEQAALWANVHDPREVAYSNNGQLAMALKYDGELHINNVNMKCNRTIPLGNLGTLCSAFSADGLWLAFGDLDGTLRVWSLKRFANEETEAPR